jgi:hypothetical protein
MEGRLREEGLRCLPVAASDGLVPPDDHTSRVICSQLRGLIHWLHTAPTSSALVNWHKNLPTSLPVAAAAADERAEARGGHAPGPTRSNHSNIYYCC